jgi:Zn-dependent M28 family amino/carboxypeptidase
MNMLYTHFIQQLDHKSDRERLNSIIGWLQQRGVAYRTQPYASGTNLIVDLGDAHKRIAIGSHFDIVEESGGANDNGSAIAVCLNIIDRFIQNPPVNTGLRLFFFDEEESGLKGSAAYTRQFGVADLTGLLNLELVGMGDKFALWPINAKSSGPLLETFEQAAKKAGISATRFDNIITNTADHVSFRKAGLADAFTITCISDKDMQTAAQYYTAMAKGAGAHQLQTIISQAPVFAHYHQPTDTWDKLDENAIIKTAAVIWDTLV